MHAATLDALDAEQEKTFTGIRNQDFEMVKSTFTEDCTFIPPGSVPLKGRAGKDYISTCMLSLGTFMVLYLVLSN